MTEPYRIAYLDDRDQAALSIIGPSLHYHNIESAGENHYSPLCFVLYDADDAIVGGVIGATYWDWLYVDLIWVKEELRHQGHGRDLLTHAEEEARHRGAANAYLDTFSFQAPAFYERLGYEVFGTLDDFPPGHRRYFMQKAL